MIRTYSLLAIFCGVMLMLPAQAHAQEFNAAQKAEIQNLFDEYLMANGEKILQSVNKYQADMEEQDRLEANKKASTFMEELLKEDNLPMTGNPKGDIVMVEFFDYNCGFCRRALEEIQKVLETDKNLKVVFMDMPILGPPSLEASKWSLAALKQGKYFEYHQAIMNHAGPKDEANLTRLAEEVGLDVKKLKADKDDKDVEATIQRHIEQARSIGISGTPGFILGGNVYPGFMPADQIKSLIADARAAAKSE